MRRVRLPRLYCALRGLLPMLPEDRGWNGGAVGQRAVGQECRLKHGTTAERPWCGPAGREPHHGGEAGGGGASGREATGPGSATPATTEADAPGSLASALLRRSGDGCSKMTVGTKGVK
jgi:hypothetical protein